MDPRKETDSCLFSTINILESFELQREEASKTRRSKSTRTKTNFSSSPKYSNWPKKENEQETSTLLLSDLLAPVNVDQFRMAPDALNNYFSTPSLPNFPWLIFDPRVLLSDDLISHFKIAARPRCDEISFMRGTQLELVTGLTQVTRFAAIEYNNWHRDTLLSVVGNLWHTLLYGNEVLSESQVTLFASTVLSLSFGGFSCSKHKQSDNTTTEIELFESQSLAACGFFSVKHLSNNNGIDVISTLPNSDILCSALRVLCSLGLFLGTSDVLLPCCIAKFNGYNDGSTSASELVSSLIRMHAIHKLVWKDPPVPYGIAVKGHEWQIQTLIEKDGKFQPIIVWAKEVKTFSDAFYMTSVIYRFASYLLETFKQLQPDYKKLSALIRGAVQNRPTDVSEKDWEAKKKLADDVMKELDEHVEDKTIESLNSVNDVNDLRPDNTTIAYSDHSPIKQFVDKLRNNNGFSNFKLIFENTCGLCQVYETSKDGKLVVMKIKQRELIEKEAKILKALAGYDVAVHMYGKGLIDNSDLGYLLLQHLKPIPKRINDAHELQTFTHELLGAVAELHDTGYIHRDIKPANVMVNKDNQIRLIDFDCAIHKKDTQFDVVFGTDLFKAPELEKSYASYYWTPEAMCHANVQGSDKSDSYSAALICTSLMYGIELDSSDKIGIIKKWLDEGRILNAATPDAVALFQWMLHSDPDVRLTATQALNQKFLLECIPESEN